MTTLTQGTLKKTCLNGYWDFQPVDGQPDRTRVPRDGWVANRYVVPSFWNKSKESLRQPGQADFRPTREGETPTLTDQTEFLWDSFEYPLAWDRTCTAWARRLIHLPTLKPGKRYFLEFEGILRCSALYVNGREVIRHYEPTLPLAVDVTDFLQRGDNEVAVLMTDYTRVARDRTLEPSGNMLTLCYCGIWQDVWLIERGDVYLVDITIHTSVRRREIEVIFDLINASPTPRTITLTPSVQPWKRGGAPGKAATVLTLPALTVTLQPGETRRMETCRAWAEAEYWQPERPTLYWLSTDIHEDEHLIERSCQRFGFREIWIEGPHILLNGFPIHMFSDWCHKLTPYHLTEAWIRQWYGMLRDANMNHTRLHAFPHPRLCAQIADEEGILITGETALYGSSGRNACERPEYWERCRDHVRRFIQRDKNHPSIVLWSVENEFRWANEGPHTRHTPVELPRLKKLMNELDPTRPAYHEGDSSLWDEKDQDIISRHYGKDCSGLGWWDRRQPLHSGELSFYHYLGPNNSVQNMGDLPWADYAATDAAAGMDTALTVEEGRTVGVCSFGPWNLSGMSNVRNQPDKVTLEYSDLTTPGIKPRVVQPYASEFTFWKKGAGYTPAPSFELLKQAFRPLAVVDRNRGHNYYTGSIIRRELFVVNDTAADVAGTLTLRLSKGKTVAFEATRDVTVARGHVGPVALDIRLPHEHGRYTYRVEFTVDGRRRDQWTRIWQIDAATCRTPRHIAKPGELAVFGTGTVAAYLTELGLPVTPVSNLDDAALDHARVLVIEKHAVQPGSTQNQQVQAFAARGGRVLLLEQHTSIFPGTPLEALPVLTAFVRAPHHPVLHGLKDEDFAYWGDEPYALIDNDGAVAQMLYRKSDGRHLLALLDAGEGAFGTGDLARSPLVEVAEGKGLLIGCQLRITDKLAALPMAGRMLARLLDRAFSYKPSAAITPHIEQGADASAIARAIHAAQGGATVLVQDIPAGRLTDWSQALGVTLSARDVGEVFQGVRVMKDSLLDGISNEDLSGIENWVYCGGKSTLVTRTALAPAEGLEALIETPTRSCLRELFPYEAKSETLRIPAISRVYFGNTPGPAVILGRVKVGKGTVLINQFAPPPDSQPRLARAMNRLLVNLGMSFPAESLLAGERIPEETGAGPGHPRQMQIFNDVLGDALRAEFIKLTVPNPERFDSMPILALANWQRLQADDGVVKAEGLDLTKTVCIYYSAVSPTQRKQPSMDLGIPNPESYTFVDFIGAGEVELIVDGDIRGRTTIREGMATISDIPLEKGVNRVLVRWTPTSSADTLQMKWRNILRQPERQLQFWGWM